MGNVFPTHILFLHKISILKKIYSLCTSVSHPSKNRGENVCDLPLLIVFRGHVEFLKILRKNLIGCCISRLVIGQNQ